MRPVLYVYFPPRAVVYFLIQDKICGDCRVKGRYQWQAEGARALAVKHALKMLREPPEKSIPQLIDWAKKFDKDGVLSSQIGGVEAVLDDPNWSRYIKSLWTDIDEGVRMKIFENFIVNSALIGMPRQQKVKDEHGCSVPWAILMDPLLGRRIRQQAQPHL